jgi:hypothetical protein
MRRPLKARHVRRATRNSFRSRGIRKPGQPAAETSVRRRPPVRLKRTAPQLLSATESFLSRIFGPVDHGADHRIDLGRRRSSRESHRIRPG